MDRAAELEWKIARKRDSVKAMPERREKRFIKKAEKQGRMRAIWEHLLRVAKRQFGYVKVRFKGLAKNTVQVVALFALSNLWMARKRLLATMEESRPQLAC